MHILCVLEIYWGSTRTIWWTLQNTRLPKMSKATHSYQPKDGVTVLAIKQRWHKNNIFYMSPCPKFTSPLWLWNICVLSWYEVYKLKSGSYCWPFVEVVIMEVYFYANYIFIKVLYKLHCWNSFWVKCNWMKNKEIIVLMKNKIYWLHTFLPIINCGINSLHYIIVGKNI